MYTWLTQNLLKIGKLNYKEKQARVTICPYMRIARTQLEPVAYTAALHCFMLVFVRLHQNQLVFRLAFFMFFFIIRNVQNFGVCSTRGRQLPRKSCH